MCVYNNEAVDTDQSIEIELDTATRDTAPNTILQSLDSETIKQAKSLSMIDMDNTA